MMKKYYCDKCGTEVTHENRFKNIEVKVEGVAFRVSIEDAIPCEYDVCKYCVLGAIQSLDDRPTCEATK